MKLPEEYAAIQGDQSPQDDLYLKNPQNKAAENIKFFLRIPLQSENAPMKPTVDNSNSKSMSVS